VALTKTLKVAQPHRLRYLITNVSGGATTDTLTQTTMAADALASSAIREFMSAVYASAAAWKAAAMEGSRLRVTITPLDASGDWGVLDAYAAGIGNLTLASQADGSAYLDVTFEYVFSHWPPV
jgi:hypothetical protein